MPDRKYTYQVEIDAAQAQTAARQLRELFTREMTQALGGKSAGASPLVRAVKEQAAAVKQATDAAKQAEREQLAAAKQAAREQAQIAKQLAREKAAAAKQAAREQAEAAREAAHEEAAIAKAAAAEVRAAQQQVTAAFKQEQKEQVAAAKQAARDQANAAREAARAQTQATGATGGRFSLGGTLRGIDGILALGMGGLAGYGAFQAGQAVYGAGREGATQERTAAVLAQTAERMNVSSQTLQNAIVSAGRGTFSQAGAQQFALQLLSQKWAPGRENITADASLLTQGGRLFSQRYSTSEGQVMSSADVTGRLLGYIREGNKELIDQFGANNAMIAKYAGVPNENLTAEDRARGLFAWLQEEVARLGDVSGTSIEQIESAEARFTDAMDRIKQALAEPVANAATFAADIVDNVTGNTQKPGLDTTRFVVQGMTQPNYMGMAPSADTKEAAENYLDVATKFDAALAKNEESARGFEAQLNALGEELYRNGGLTADQYTTLNELAVRLQLVADGNDAYSRTMGKVTEEGVRQNTELLAIARAMAGYEEMLISGQITMPQYMTGLARLAEHLGVVATAAGYAAGALSAVNAATSAKPGGSVTTLDAWMRGQEIQAAGRGRALVDAAGSASRSGRQAVNPLTGQPIISGPGGSSKAGDAMDNFSDAVGNFQEQEAAKAARAWSSAADKTAKAFAQAAEDAAGAFEDALGKVPGLFGTSSVTAQDMADAEAGVYQPKADEYLRQLRDEVLNGKDYAGVDLADIAGVAGVDQGLSKEAQLRQIEGMWNDSSLFANPDALRFINRDAIQAQQDRDTASAAGKANIYAMLGLGPDSPLTPDQQAAYAQMTGTEGRRILTGANGQAMALTIGGQGGQALTPEELQAATAAPEQTPQQAVAAALAKPENTGGGGKAFLDELLAGLTPEQIGGETAKTLQALGTSIFGAIFTGYETAAGEADWSEAVVAGLVDEVLPGVLAALEGNL